jgi:hypothetical protein
MKYFQSLILVLAILVCLGSVQFASAANLGDAFKASPSDGTTCSDGGLGCAAAAAHFNTGEKGTLESVIGFLMTVLLSLVGIVFMTFLFFGGFIWITAGGNETKIDRSKSILKQGIVGLLIVFGAYALSYFLLSLFAGGRGLK